MVVYNEKRNQMVSYNGIWVKRRLQMLFQEINYWAVFVTGILSLVLGFLWMAVIWAKPYQKHMYGKGEQTNLNVSKADKIQSFVMYILVSFITSIAFAVCLELWKSGGQAFGYDGD